MTYTRPSHNRVPLFLFKPPLCPKKVPWCTPGNPIVYTLGKLCEMSLGGFCYVSKTNLGYHSYYFPTSHGRSSTVFMSSEKQTTFRSWAPPSCKNEHRTVVAIAVVAPEHLFSVQQRATLVERPRGSMDCKQCLLTLRTTVWHIAHYTRVPSVRIVKPSFAFFYFLTTTQR